jgi:hypothetical protein
MPLRSTVVTDGINPRIKDILDRFQTTFPEVDVTSGYRSPSYNAGVNGAKASRHMHGDAFDFSGKGLSPERSADAVNWLRSQGATGLGTYKDGSFHVDWKPGGNRAWGPDRSFTSLGQTPGWFQDIASDHRSGVKFDGRYATVPSGSIPSVPAQAPAQAAPRPSTGFTAPAPAPVPPRPSTGFAPQAPAQAPVPRASTSMPTMAERSLSSYIAMREEQAHSGDPKVEALARPQTPPTPTTAPTPPTGPIPSTAAIGYAPTAPAATSQSPQDLPTIGDGTNPYDRVPLEYKAPPVSAQAPMASVAPMAPGAPPIRQIPIDGAPRLHPNPVTANPDASAPTAPLVISGIRPTSQTPAPQAFGGYAPLPPQRPADSQLFAQPTPQAPAENPLVVRGIRPTIQAQAQAPAENPLVVRGIRPTSQDQQPFASTTVPLPPSRPSDSQLFAGYAPQQPQRPQSPQQPQQSQGTIWGANYHGPELGLLNVLGGAKPDYNSGVQEWRTPQQWMNGESNVRPPETYSQTPQDNSPKYDSTPGSGFFDFLRGLGGS